MVLNERAMQRLRAVTLQGDEIANMFKVLAENATEVGSAESAATLQYKTDGTAEVGEYIPQIVLVITKVTDENKARWDEVRPMPVFENSEDLA